LFAMLSRLGVDMIDMGVVRDDREATKDAFLEAARNADAIVTMGCSPQLKTVLVELK